MTYLDPIRQAASEFAPPPQEPDHPFGDFDKEDPALKPQQASMVSPFDTFDKEAPTGDEPAPGSLRRTVREFARGPYRAALGLGGAIADIGPALRYGTPMTSGAKWTHELGLDRPEDATWYEKGADVAGQLLPGMVAGVGISGKVLPTVVQDLAASQVFGPLGEKIGTKLGLAPGRAQALGIGASVLGSGGTATGVNRVLGRVKPPTGEAILDSAKNGYSKVENMPIRWDPNALADNVTNDLAQRMKTSGADITARSAYRMLGALRRTDPQDGAVGLGQVWGVQKELKNLAKQTDAQGHYTPDAHWAGETVKSINQFMENAKDNPSWALSGQQFLPDMSETLAKANQDYSSAMWDDTFGKAYDKAKLSASTVTGPGNLPTNVRREFAKFLDPFHPARSLGLRPDELTQLNQIARGRNLTQNALRGIAGVAPESKLGLYVQAAGLGAAMGGNPGGLLLPAVGVAGSLAKRASNRMQKGQIENLRNTVRARSALAQSMRNAEPGSGGEAGEAAEAGIAGVLGEEAPEWVNRAAGAGADTGANAEKEKEAEGGGYAMGHRLLKAVGGYDSSFFNQPTIGDQAMSEVALNRASGATPKDILRSVTSPTAQGIGQDVGMAMAPIEAYHGSPYDFNAFDSSKIGTGEGAQAYGHGLYFADREGVARDYKQKLSGSTVNGQPYDVNNPLHKAASIIDEVGSREAAIADVRQRAAHDPGDFYQDVLRHLQSGKPLPKIDSGGKMYQVEIGSEPEHFLDWDKPLSEQSEHVKAALKPYGFKEGPQDLGEFEGQKIEGAPMTGAHAYKRLAIKHGGVTQKDTPAGTYPLPYTNEQAASKALQDAGIPGIRYLDQGSRGTGQGTHNYVVFDPKIIRIMRKYGIFGPAAVAGASMGQQKKPGGYDNPQGEQYADPEAFRLKLARLAAMPQPQTGVGGGVPFPQQAIGGGAVPQPNYRVGGYSTKGGGYDDSRMPMSHNVADRRSYDESKLHWPWTISANERRFYPQGDPVFEAPILPPPVYTGQLGAAAGINDIPGPAPTVGATGMMNAGGYDGMTGLLDRMAAPIVAEHSQPWNMGRIANVLGQALGTMGAGAPESTPPLSDVISPTQYGAGKANPLLAPQYSTGKSDRLPLGNVPWPQVPGGYGRRRRGGYSVSPMTGGTGY